MFNRDNVKSLHIETSSVCNAACPMCPREIDPMFNKDTDAVSLSLEKIKTMFSDSFIRQLDNMYMCGNYGDPAAAPDCINIFKHFRNINDQMYLGMHSNASLRSKEWWSELGSVLSRKNDYCVFSIDGLNDTNHIHRVNTNFDKIVENAKSFINNGGRAIWDYIVFEHNEHQVEQARQLSKELGFVEFRVKVSRRFNWVITNLKPPKGTYD